MPNFSGIWTVAQQFQARGQDYWPRPPAAPTSVSGTAGNAQVSVAFTAPSCTGKYPAGVSTYTATSTPGCFTATGASSPLTVTGLTNGTAYTFRVRATGSNGLSGPCSAASGSVTPTNAGSQSYTTAGTYTWIAPACVTSVSVVAIGGGGAGCRVAGAGGGLGYKNNYSVTPGSSYTVVVGAAGSRNAPLNGNASYFVSSAVVQGNGGLGAVSCRASFVGDGGGQSGGGGGGSGCFGGGGGGGAGGYSGNGGNGGSGTSGSAGASGAGGGAGGGGGGYYYAGGGGGGVGLFGSGSNGSGGSGAGTPCYPGNVGRGGSGGSCGTSGQCGSTSTPGLSGGGLYGGGGGGRGGAGGGNGSGGGGAVRIVWPGNTRTFPSTNVGSP